MSDKFAPCGAFGVVRLEEGFEDCVRDGLLLPAASAETDDAAVDA